MESRGVNDDLSKSRPAVARRSCDQCRARKIGCDRGSPCSNCLSARVSCTHSAVATKQSTPKQRVLISAQYERKIDDIANDINSIRQLFQSFNTTPDLKQVDNGLLWRADRSDSEKRQIEEQHLQWEYPTHIKDFVKAVLEDGGFITAGSEENEVVLSLRKVLQTLDKPPSTPVRRHLPKISIAKDASSSPMPPLEAVITVLRWAKDHDEYFKMAWISRILPLDTFAEVCRKVYFPVEAYDEIDFILTNAYLSYTFSEHVVVSGLEKYREYSRLCRKNLDDALSRLPLLLPQCMEVVAVLTLGAFNAIENSRPSVAWNYVSAASNLCQTLEYHRTQPLRGNNMSSRVAERRLFWTVYRLEKGLSLRFARSSNIRDAEVTIPFEHEDARHSRLGRIQGSVYEQIYSASDVSQAPDDRKMEIANTLAREVQELINEKKTEIYAAAEKLNDDGEDPLRTVHLRFELVCHLSLLTLILRAIPPLDTQAIFSDDCVAAARECLDVHQQCITGVRSCKNDPFLDIKYMNWAILHTPFVPFSILFSRVVQLFDIADLSRLEKFAASLQPQETSPKTTVHPHRLYELLCQTARIYINACTLRPSTDEDWMHDASANSEETDFNRMNSGTNTLVDEGMGSYDFPGYGLNEWYLGNQQLLSLLDEDMVI